MTEIQDEIDRLSELRRRALENGLNETVEDRALLRQLDKQLARLYGKKVAAS